MDNVLNGYIMQKRFHSDPRIQSVESLLYEGYRRSDRCCGERRPRGCPERIPNRRPASEPGRKTLLCQASIFLAMGATR